MKLGVTLPSFRLDAVALDAACQAEDAGLDGVFVFDHLWPMGRPDRPALAAVPLLGALAARTERVVIGPLVARVGLVPDGLLVAEILSLEAMAPGRVVAGLGTGDSKSAEENIAYGIPYAPASLRRASLEWCATMLLGRGVPVWVGGGAPATTAIAARAGAAVNLWGASPEVIGEHAGHGEVTWAGPTGRDVRSTLSCLELVAAAGATWAVIDWTDEPGALEALAQAVCLLP